MIILHSLKKIADFSFTKKMYLYLQQPHTPRLRAPLDGCLTQECAHCQWQRNLLELVHRGAAAAGVWASWNWPTEGKEGKRRQQNPHKGNFVSYFHLWNKDIKSFFILQY